LDQSPTYRAAIFCQRKTSAKQESVEGRLRAIHEVSLLVLAICAGIFLVVGGLLAYTVVRFRQRPTDQGQEPPQIYGSNQLEFAWTVIPIVTVFVLFLKGRRI